MVTQAANTDLLGIGLYTAAEAALYARLPPVTLSRWLWGTGERKPVCTPELSDEKLVSFLDFVTTMAVRSIRVSSRAISLQKIRAAITMAEEEYGVRCPLARKHSIYLFGDEVVISLPTKESRRLVQLTGKRKRNMLIPPIAEPFLLDLSFDGDGLASIYNAYTYKEYDVQLNPKVRFGEPLVPLAGYSARALWDAFRDEGSLEGAAEAYGVEVDAVRTACRYFDHLTIQLPSN